MSNVCLIGEPGSASAGSASAGSASAGSDAAASSGGSGAPSAADLRALVGHLRDAERHLAAAVGVAGRLAGSGVCERVEGLPLEHFLGLAARLTGADRRMLVTAGEVLSDLPVIAGLFAQGAVSWGQVRAIAAAARRLRRADRAVLDARLGATVAERAGLDGFDPDQLVDAAAAAVDDLYEPRRRERAEARQRQASFLALQAGFDGGVRLYGELDPVLGATVVNALDTAAGPPTPDSRDGAGPDGERNHADPDGDAAGGPDGDGSDAPAGGGTDAAPGEADADRDAVEGDVGGGWCGTARGRQYAGALGRICSEWLGGGSGRPARPLLVAHVDTAQTAATAAGTIELAVRGGLTRVTAATIERLAVDADLRAVLFDGARPLAESAKTSTASIPAAVRRAVAARDQGCRFPGSRDPLAHTDLHHLVPRACGGDHHPDNLIALSRRYHTLTHRHDWTLTLDPATGEITARRDRRVWRSLPHHTALSQPAPTTDDNRDDRPGGDDRRPAGDRDPPDLPF